MSSPEISKQMVCVDGIYRPELSDWMEKLPRTVQGLNRQFFNYQNNYPKLITLTKLLAHHSQFVEPVDRILGIDPQRLKSNSFRIGVYVGSVLVAPLIDTDRDVVDQATKFVSRTVTPSLKQASGQDAADTAHRRGDVLMNMGGAGRAAFEEVDQVLDEFTDLIENNISNQLYTKAGAGVAMFALWNGFRDNELAKIEQASQQEMTDDQFAAAVAGLFAE